MKWLDSRLSRLQRRSENCSRQQRRQGPFSDGASLELQESLGNKAPTLLSPDSFLRSLEPSSLSGPRKQIIAEQQFRNVLPVSKIRWHMDAD